MLIFLLNFLNLISKKFSPFFFLASSLDFPINCIPKQIPRIFFFLINVVSLIVSIKLNFSKYLKSIDVMDISPDNNVRFNRAMVRRNQSNLINYLEDNNIQFNIVDSYKYTNNKPWQTQHPRKSR
jgi:hypothetical protein